MTLTTALTGSKEFETIRAGADSKEAITEVVKLLLPGNLWECCDSGRAGCSAECKVEFEDGGPREVAFGDPRLFGAVVGLAVMAMGSVGVCGCALCGGIAAASQGRSRVRVEDEQPPTQFHGAGSGQGGAPETAASMARDVASLRRGVDGLALVVHLVAVGLGVLGVVAGAYVAVALYCLSGLQGLFGAYTPGPGAFWLGIGLAVIFLLLAAVAHWGVRQLQGRLQAIIEELCLEGGSVQDVQKRLAAKLVAMLQSPRGKKCKAWLLEAGIGEEQITAIAAAPQERMPDVLFEQLGRNVLARIACQLLEDSLASQYGQGLLCQALCLVIAPATLATLVMWLGSYCATFSASLAAGAPAPFLALSVLLAMLGWYVCCFAASGAQQVTMLIMTVVTWASSGTNALSVILFILSLHAILAWLAIALFFLALLKPLEDAVFELVLEELRYSIWGSFGCQRDPEKRRECRDVVARKAYCLKPAVESFLSPS